MYLAGPLTGLNKNLIDFFQVYDMFNNQVPNPIFPQLPFLYSQKKLKEKLKKMVGLRIWFVRELFRSFISF